MKLTVDQVIALRHLMAATPLMSAGDQLAHYFQRECSATKEAAEALAIADLKILIDLNSQLKEYLA